MGAGSTTTAAFADQVNVVCAEFRDAARATFSIAKRVYTRIDDDAERAQQTMASGLERVYGDLGRGLLSVAVCGTPEDCIKGLAAVAEAGAEMIVLNPLDDDLAQLGRLATDVLPHV